MLTVLALAAACVVQAPAAASSQDEGRGAVMSPERIRAHIHPGVIRPSAAPAPVASAPEPAGAPVGRPAGTPAASPASAPGGVADVRLVGLAILLLASGILLSRVIRKVRA